MIDSMPAIIGQVEAIDLPTHGIQSVPARIDTGARTSAIWATNIKFENGKIQFTLFDTSSPYYTGELIELGTHSEAVVASSVGQPQLRYKVQLPIRIKGKRIKASFTLADRSTQTYPILIGRSTLRGKFIVDVKAGTVFKEHEKKRTAELRNLIDFNQENN